MTDITPLSIDQQIQQRFSRLSFVLIKDKALIKSRLFGLKKISNPEKVTQILQSIDSLIDASIAHKAMKLEKKPVIEFPAELPVSQQVDVISDAISQNQVVIIAGETGSGKTTQIPKICLALGRGVEGLIGHTQPRRIAARSVSTRIAEELNSELGQYVGYKVRFNDQVSDQTFIKLMTDGILLAEMQKDRLLRQYDTLIIDEAHERSLNIDFILGYIKQILPKRPDLKVIITSATIDPQRFSAHFNNAPIIEVSGRTYPVDILYRPLNEDSGEADFISGIINSVHELSSMSNGDILVFLNGEREIRDTAKALEQENFPHTQILPLFARLSIAEQNQIFKPHTGRNIVLATNVAETSLTVPGIKYVIDPGTARISRYSFRTKVQRLPIEAISQASANQRSGRCGRVSSGVCIRLYSEEDFNNRPAFTDPEILRTNLATVILQMLALGLGDIGQFPFVEPPDSRNITDGVRLLEELAAVSEFKNKNGQLQLTPLGINLARLPIDPRLGRMVVSALENGCADAVMVIVSALSIQDPRERPSDKQQASDLAHARFKDKSSDFISILNLWRYINEQQKLLSNSQFRRLCQKEFLSFIRIREWQDIVSQLRLAVRETKIVHQQRSADITDEQLHDLIHQSLLTGLLSHLGNIDENREYKGARGSKFFIFPGSTVAKSSPKWLMAAELVETSRLFARMVAKIEVDWIEPVAGHLLKRSYSEPHWLKKQGAVFAYEQITLYGMVIVAKRRVNFSKIEPETCHNLFIREALVNDQLALNEKFIHQNRALIDEIIELEVKARRRDYLVDDEVLVSFYKKAIPATVNCQRSFAKWWRIEKQKTPKLLTFTKDFLLKESATSIDAASFPKIWKQGNLMLPISYHFDPSSDDDGISIEIPVGILNQVQDIGFDWLLPAQRLELIIGLIKSLPKTLRRNFVPAPNYAEACLAAMTKEEGKFCDAIAKHLLRMSGVMVNETDWNFDSLPNHLKMNFKMIDDKGKLVAQGRNLTLLKEKLQGQVKASIKKVADKGIEQKELTKWSFDKLPTSYEKSLGHIKIQAFPALVDHKSSVAIELFDHEILANRAMVDGVSRLILLNIPSPIKFLETKLPNKAKLGLYFNPFGSVADLLADCILACTRHLISQQPLPRTEVEFNVVRDLVRAEIADHVLATAIKVEKALSLTHDINKKLKGNVSLALVQAQGDIKQHIQNLVFKGFVTETTVARLDDLLRYITAITRRFEKLSIDPNQDRLRSIEVQKANDLYQGLLAQQRKDIPISQEIADVRWMIEEFKVSLFAQNLGTAYPVSLKRIKQTIAALG